MPLMKRQVQVQMTVEFNDDELPTPDIDEAIVDAVQNAQKLLMLMPALKGKSKRGRQTEFRIKTLEVRP
jgi:hypothetical protein